MDPDQGAGSALTPFNKLSETAQTELRDNCQKLYEQLELLHNDIVLSSDSGETLPESLNRLILTESELSLILNSPVNLSSKHPEVLREAVNEEKEKLCSELQMVLSWNKVKKQKLLEDCEREQKLLEEKHEVYKAAIAHYEQIRKDTRSTKKCLKDLKDKIDKLVVYHEKILDVLMGVVDQHFPIPDDQVPQEGLLPFEKILERLMNKALQTTHDPYITIDKTFWPPYVEALLRYGIAVRHPEDNFQIRLESFD